MYYLLKLCRLCTNYSDMSLTLSNLDANNITFLDKLNTISPGIIESGSELPNNICANCISKLNDAYRFIKICVESQTILQRYLEEIQCGKAIDESSGIKSVKNNESNAIKVEKGTDLQINTTAEVQVRKNNINFEYVHVKSELETDFVNEGNEFNIKKGNFELGQFSEEINIKNEINEETINVDDGRICNSAISDSVNYNIVASANSKSRIDKRYQCKMCEKYFWYKSQLTRHIPTHSDVRPHKCEICGKAFIRKDYLQVHIRSHTNERPYRCEICGKAFICKDNLNVHTRIHTQSKPYKCKICEKAFSQSNTLKEHFRRHTNEKPHVCEICKKAFIQGQSLKKHMLTHTKEKPYRCEICNGAYSDKAYLKVHIRTQHNEQNK